MSRDDHLAEVSQLRHAVEKCIVTLGSGLLRHPANGALRQRFSSGKLDESQFYRQLQLLLLQMAGWILGETIGIVPDGSVEAKGRYLETYSAASLSKQPQANDVSPGLEIWKRLSRVLLAVWQGDEAIAVTCWGSTLFDPAALNDLLSSNMYDEHVASVLSILSKEILVNSRPDDATVSIDFQVLGRIHEWLLELQPAMS